MNDDLLANLRIGFRQEARELLQELNTVVLSLESQPDDRQLLDRAFRGVHTLKGSGGTAGMKELSAFAHKLEEVFTAAREGRLRVNSEIVAHTLKALDLIEKMVETDAALTDRSKIAAMEAALSDLLPRHAVATPASSQVSVATNQQRERLFRISFKPDQAIFYSGADPKNLIEELFTLGKCRVAARTNEIPPLDQMDPEKCYLAWDIELISSLPEEKMREVFAFVESESELHISATFCDETLKFDNTDTFAGDSLRDFFAEAQEQLTGIEESLLTLETNPAVPEPLNALFRFLHNLKGNAGVLLSERTRDLPPHHPLFYIQRVGHSAESLVEEVRANGAQALDPEKIEFLFVSLDLLKKQVSSFDRNEIAPVHDNELLAKFGLSPDLIAQAGSPEPAASDSGSDAFSEIANQCFEAIGLSLASLANGGGDSASLWKTCSRSLKTLIAAAHYQALNPLTEILKPAFEFIDKTPSPSQDQIRWLQAQLQKAKDWVQQLQPRDKCATLPPPPVDTGIQTAKPSVRGRETRTAHASIRVDQEKLDKLMRVVGELLVARGALPLLAQKISQQGAMPGLGQEVKEVGGTISRIANELQSTVMGLRMLPLRTAFQKFPRMIRDLARSLGKEVSFQTSGEDIEMDKTVIEQISDPLMHLLRNAIDHGLETPDQRRIKGKPTAGTITLSAANEANHIIIRVSDDGSGLDAQLLKTKAVAKGLITIDRSREMNDQQAYQLIFIAGFSTKEKATDVSGRGVGMDVVKTNLRQLHGSIEIDTRASHGTTFTIRLPTSLMVSRGILLKSAGEEYILPMENARDLVKIPATAVRSFHHQKVAHVRGHVFPLASLDELLDASEARPHSAPAIKDQASVAVAIIHANELQYGLIVDQFVTEVEVIIKPLAGELANLRLFLGATIMGDGRLVLILNPAELFQQLRTDKKTEKSNARAAV